MAESPISYWKLRFKDDDLNKKFVEQHRRVVYERAKLYIVYFIFLLVITPLYFPLFGKETMTVMFSIGAATMVGISIPTIIARFRVAATEFIMIGTTVMRGLALWYVLKYHLPRTECVPIFDLARKYLNLYLLCTDVVLFRINFFTTFLAIFLYLFSAGLNFSHQAQEDAQICKD